MNPSNSHKVGEQEKIRIFAQIETIKFQQEDILSKCASFSVILKQKKFQLKRLKALRSRNQRATQKQTEGLPLALKELRKVLHKVSEKKLEANKQAAAIRRLFSSYAAQIRRLKKSECHSKQTITKLRSDLEEWKISQESTAKDYESASLERQELLNRIEELNSKLVESETGRARLGSVCGTLLWKSTKETDLAGKMLQASEVVEEFFEVASQGVYRLFESPTEDEEWMALSFTGAVANLVGSIPGRSLLLDTEEGRNFLETLCACLSTGVGNQENQPELRRLILMLLHNLSLSRQGLEYLKETFSVRLLPTGFGILEGNDELGIKTICSRLVVSLLSGTSDRAIAKILKAKVPIVRLERIAHKNGSDLKCDMEKFRRILLKAYSA